MRETKFPSIDSRWIWIALGALTLMLRYLFSLNPAFTEVIYSRGIFALIRTLYDYTLGLLPIPMLYLMIAAIIGGLVYRWRNRHKVPRKLKNRVARFGINSLAFLGGLIFFFYLLWGFNYYRPSVEAKLELGEIQPDSSLIFGELELTTRELLRARNELQLDDSTDIELPNYPDKLESRMREGLCQKLDSLGFGSPGRVRIRKIYPNGALMRSGALGIYIPFVIEGHYDAAIHPLTHPSTIAHEMSHGYGFGDEGTANFFAWLTTQSDPDPMIRYAGNLSYWRHVAVQAFRTDTAAYRQVTKTLPFGVKQDLRNISAQHKKYPALFPLLYRKIYDSYLKSQGVRGGIKSYSRVVNLVLAWREKRKSEVKSEESGVRSYQK